MSTLTFDDIGAFLPDGFKSSTTEKPDFSDQLGGLFKDVYTDDVSKLLPPGFNFINILRAPFLYKSVLHSFSLITV